MLRSLNTSCSPATGAVGNYKELSYGAKIAVKSIVEGRLPKCIDALGSVLEGRPRGKGADLCRIPAWKAAATSDRPNRVSSES